MKVINKPNSKTQQIPNTSSYYTAAADIYYTASQTESQIFKTNKKDNWKQTMRFDDDGSKSMKPCEGPLRTDFEDKHNKNQERGEMVGGSLYHQTRMLTIHGVFRT